VLAIDANVVVRYLVDDDHDQFLRACRLVESEPIFVADTVLLECEWVLRSGYGFEARQFAAALRALAGLPTVRLESPQIAAVALAWHEQGMDFADALHLAGADGCEAFATFDRRLAKTAARLGATPVRALCSAQNRMALRARSFGSAPRQPVTMISRTRFDRPAPASE